MNRIGESVSSLFGKRKLHEAFASMGPDEEVGHAFLRLHWVAVPEAARARRINRSQGEVSYDSFRRWWVRRTIAKEGGAQVSVASPRSLPLMGGGARRCRPTAIQCQPP
jgi:hypothetical protein